MKTLVIKDIKGNVYAYSGKPLEYVELKHASQVDIPANSAYIPFHTNTENFFNALGQTIQKIKDTDDPTRIIFGDGICWYTEHSVDNIDFKRCLENDVVEIDRCFFINTFYDGHEDD